MRTILLADDDEDIRTVFGMSLERYYRVLVAATGTAWWAMLPDAPMRSTLISAALDAHRP
jgi:CheY-like chemotaxis protein